MTSIVVEKQCTVCKHKVKAFADRRVCRQPERNSKGFRTGYRCPGKLVPVSVLRKAKRRAKEHARTVPPLDPKLGIGQVLSEEWQQRSIETRGEAWRETAKKQLARARQRHKDAEARARRAEKQMVMWTKEIRHLEKRARMSNAEVEAVRQRAATAAQVSHVKRRLSKAAAGVKEGPA